MGEEMPLPRRRGTFLYLTKGCPVGKWGIWGKGGREGRRGGGRERESLCALFEHGTDTNEESHPHGQTAYVQILASWPRPY
jgi:hypothetical protein